jgi:hypothetical protein
MPTVKMTMAISTSIKANPFRFVDRSIATLSKKSRLMSLSSFY